MWVPEPFFKQASVLIADQHSFSALYLAHALSLAGCKVIGPFASHDELDLCLSERCDTFSVAVIALDWVEPAQDRLTARLKELRIPYLAVDNAPWRHADFMPVSFSWPYGAFQVLEALQHAAFEALAAVPQPE